MAIFNPSTGTATISSGNNVATISGANITFVREGMVIYFGSRLRAVAPGYIIASAAPTGNSGGTITLLDSVPSAITSQGFVIDDGGGGNTTLLSYVSFLGTRILSAVSSLTGAGSSNDENSKILDLNKLAAGAVSRLRFLIAGVNQFEISQRTIGGVENLAIRSTNDGSTLVDAILINRTTGIVTIPLRAALSAGIGQCGSSSLNNTNVGTSALQSNTTGYNNTANGVSALQSNTTGYNNTANGQAALSANTTGYNNTANGQAALSANTTGYNNTANGVSALSANTTGSNNTANGVSALLSNTTGSTNTANGVIALQSNTTGYNNTANGFSALSANTTQFNTAGLGYNAQISGSNQVQLGDSATTTYVYGTVQNRSDARDKADIRPTKLGLAFVLDLNPVDYRWDMREDYLEKAPAKVDNETDADFSARVKAWAEARDISKVSRDGTKKRSRYHSGLIAQDLEVVTAKHGFDKKGWGALQDHSIGGGHDVKSVGYDQFIAPLIRAIQEQQEMIEGLTARVAALEAGKV